MGYTGYYIHGGGADYVVVLNDDTREGTSLVVDRQVFNDFAYSEETAWDNWNGEDLDFIQPEDPEYGITMNDLEQAFGGEIIAMREGDKEVAVTNPEVWQTHCDFFRA